MKTIAITVVITLAAVAALTRVKATHDLLIGTPKP
jgi:hypothetical protein